MKLVALAAIVAVLIVPAALGSTPALNGTDGPGFTIMLKKSGVKVTKLKHGTYVFKIADKSSIHNFHLKGPGVDKKTGVPFVGTKSWTVTLKAGKYMFVCDPHVALGMKGSFTVT